MEKYFLILVIFILSCDKSARTSRLPMKVIKIENSKMQLDSLPFDGKSDFEISITIFNDIKEGDMLFWKMSKDNEPLGYIR